MTLTLFLQITVPIAIIFITLTITLFTNNNKAHGGLHEKINKLSERIAICETEIEHLHNGRKT